jgi:hypothetical protein
VAPSVADTIDTDVPSAVPKSSPLAPASSGPGKRATVRHALMGTKSSGPAAPSESTRSRTVSADSERLRATMRKAAPTSAAKVSRRSRIEAIHAASGGRRA